MLRALEVDPIDRGNIEEEIRTTIANIQADKNKLTGLRYLASSIACGEYRIREPYKLRSAKSVEQQEDSLDIYEIDGIILKGCTKSVASVIKANAIKTAMTVKSFDNLTDQQKVGVSLGFSLIVDLSKNDSLCGSQKPLFPEEAWQELKNRHNMLSQKTNNTSKLCLINKESSVLRPSGYRTATEQNFMGEVWTPILSAVFNDPHLKLKWGDSIAKESTTAKRDL
ncbi:hypothetical protein G6F37_010772 [Rhizopus arrhizus]|nr:hypothetical protein G6F38_008677 [Rhizopus arrhizus]KAG1152634.1 hypothetical protein G6F37_010772 [Rhizopus arrhizus]